MKSGGNWTLRRLLIALAAAVLVVAVVVGAGRMLVDRAKSSEPSQAAKKDPGRFTPTDAEWAALAFEPAKEQEFRAEHITEGKIAVNEDSSTPVFSPYAGRVAKLLVKPSDTVERGQALFVIEATDTVQALNDFITALSTLNSARSKLNLAADQREASERSLCRQGGAAEGLAGVAGRADPGAERSARRRDRAGGRA